MFDNMLFEQYKGTIQHSVATLGLSGRTVLEGEDGDVFLMALDHPTDRGMDIVCAVDNTEEDRTLVTLCLMDTDDDSNLPLPDEPSLTMVNVHITQASAIIHTWLHYFVLLRPES